MQKVTLTKVYRGMKVVKKGTPEESSIPNVAIKTQQHGDSLLSTFKTRGTEEWKEGDEVLIVVDKNGQYLNFRLPDRLDYIRHDVEKLKKFVGYKEPVKEETKEEEETPQTSTNQEDINPDDIPFN